MRHNASTIEHAPATRRERREPLKLDNARAFTSPTDKAADQRTRAAPLAAARREARRRSLLRLEAACARNISQTANAALTDGAELTGASPDSADLAQELTEQDVAVSLMGSALGTVAQIEEALDRIDEGSYGICEECGVTIPAERLEAVPYATHCVRCAARLEEAGGLH